MRLIRLTATVALAGLCLSGCSAESRVKLVPVVGTVTQGGKPLEGAALSFIPDPGNADSTAGTASSGPTGYYAAKWLTRTGLAPGHYQVLITADPMSADNVPEEFASDPMMAQLEKQARPATEKPKKSAVKSEFDIEVTDGEEPFDFDVGPAPSK